LAHPVKCFYCQQTFDRDKEAAILVAERRYAHAKCVTEERQKDIKEQQDLKELENYVKQLFNTSYVSAKIKRQIRDYRQEYHYTYSGIYKTLVWWYEIKKNTIEKANNGIGIVPFVYQDAYEYYKRLYLAQTINELSNIDNYNPEVIEVSIGSPRATSKPVRLFEI
jgi:hypothetical protein